VKVRPIPRPTLLVLAGMIVLSGAPSGLEAGATAESAALPAGASSEPPDLIGGEGRTGAIDFVQDRPRASADTARARVLDRMRNQGRPSDEASPADTLEARDREPGDTLAGPPTDTLAPRPSRLPPRKPPLPAEADSLMRVLYDLAGYDMSVYEGTRADFEARDRVMVLRGTPEERARFAGRGTMVEADSSITYDDRIGRVRTVGPSLLVPEEGDRVISTSLVYDMREDRGSAVGAQTTYEHGGRWIVSGDLTSVRPEPGEVFGRTTRFTSCELDPPHSYFQADQFKVIRDRVLVARSVQMYVDDVPVIWLPFIAQSLGTGRASGLLSPSFSINDVVRTSAGQSRRISNVGFYWAMSEYSDMTVAGEWFSNNYTAVRSSTRYRWRRQFLEGNLDFSHFWQETGQRQLTLATRHSWVASERTRLRANARYASSSGFIRQHTFDPRELNQTIDSDAGLTHRFDWGQLSLGANRRQFLNEDRTNMTLPTANLSLSTITFFGAPPTEASWYNNMSMSGRMNWTRDLEQRPLQADTLFSFGRTSQLRTRGGAQGSLGLGRLSLSGNVNMDERRFEDVPARFLPGGAPDPFADPRVDVEQADVTWSTSLGFQQRLMGATTLTPSISMDGRLMRVDTIAAAQDFVAGPTRVRVGAGLQTDLYGFYPGFGGFDAIRHKITPNLRWSYAPEVTATELQERVFGFRDARVQHQFTFGINQTWEARLPEREEPRDDRPPSARPGERDFMEEVEDPFADPPPAAPEVPARDTAEILRGLEPAPDELEEDEEETPTLAPAGARDDEDGPRRLPQSRVVTLLALQTSAVTYDVVRRDETGRFVDGFTTTSLSNSIRSDFLQGLSLSFAHDLFDDRAVADGGTRSFSPHLSQLSFAFSLSDRSGLVRAIGGLLGADPSDPEEDRRRAEEEEREEDEDMRLPGDREDGFRTDRIMPDDRDPAGPDEVRGTPAGGWNARISYSLRRPRPPLDGGAARGRAQMVQTSLSFRPSENWEASWSTSYDVEAGRFNDHMVNLRRDLHEWEATFGFRQTATGNWSFQFEISLRANRDLQVDFEQRSLDARGLGAGGPQQPF